MRLFTIFTFYSYVFYGSLKSATNLKHSKGVKVGSMKSSCITYPTMDLYLLIPSTVSPLILSSPLSYRLSESILPEMRLSMVVFPQPDGPRIAVKVPGEKRPEHSLRIVLKESTATFFPFTTFSSLTAATTLML